MFLNNFQDRFQGSGGETYTVFDEESESDVENLQKPWENQQKMEKQNSNKIRKNRWTSL